MTPRDLLIGLYPRRWRDEYGEEFAAVLAARPLGLATVVDVVGGALRQQWRERSGWMYLLAAGMAVSAANLVVPFRRGGSTIVGLAVMAVMIVAACRARMRGGSGYGAAMKVFWLCWGPDLVLAELVCLGVISRRPLLCFRVEGAELPSVWAFTCMGALVMVLEVCVPAMVAWVAAGGVRRVRG